MSANNAIIAAPEFASPIVRNRVAIFASDDITAAALRTGLEGANLDIKRGNIRNAIRFLENDIDLLALIVDISGIDDPAAALRDLSRVCPGDVAVAMVGDNTDINFYRMVVNDLGVCEYLPKPLTRDTVQTVLRPKLFGDIALEPVDRGGHVISVCGAQGGAGATTFAVNLAADLGRTTKGRVALLDLHLQGGETAVMFGAQPGPGLRTALEDPTRADTLFLERTAIEVTDRVRLIAADEKLVDQVQITEAGVRHVLDLLRQRFNYIVVDVPVWPMLPAIRPVIAMSRHVLVLLESEITGLRNTLNLREVVTEIAGKNKVFTVLNRANRQGGLSVPIITKHLNGAPDFLIPDLGHRMTDAVNTGALALDKVPALRRHLAPVVQEIAGIADTRKRFSIWRMLGR